MRISRAVALVAVLWLSAGTALPRTRCSGAGRDTTSGPDRPDPGFPKGAAAKVALLVGIDDYQAGGEGATFHDLQGCVRDVQRFRSTLLSPRFGFKPEDIVVLTNEQATHENIVRAFDR
ncbi:MAG: caspase family protein, partial [Planctomycetes bacterium]|nr:caspase family protein [Planctomycetota bacterium]